MCKDSRSAGLSSLREDLYSPTGSLESLRIVLALAGWFNLGLATLDISTAFLYSKLLEHERQPVRLPPSTLSSDGQRMVLFLRRALYGLRRAPLAWFRTMNDAFLEFGAERTSEVTVFRFTGYLKESKKEYFMLALIYVDDLLLAASDPSCISWLVECPRSKFETKLTGELPARVAGSLTFLGREIVRTHYDDSLLLGLPLDYFDKIEEGYGIPLKPVSSPPRLARLVENSECDEDLSEKDAKRYRTTLGKLAWFSLTVPVIQYQVSWLSCFQSRPTVNADKGMGEVLRYAKTFAYFRQRFGASMAWQDVTTVVALVDASWSTRSSSGGFIFFAGSMIKSFSRRIATTCLSSAEAECHALNEGASEAVSVAITAQTFLEGLPERDPRGDLVEVTGRYPLVLHSDSEAAKCIASMAGLLRKVRHLELRMLRIQELTASGRLVMKFVPGARNGSDALTKDSDRVHAQLLLEAAGLEPSKIVSYLEDVTQAACDYGVGMSSQTYSKLLEVLQKTLRTLDLSGCSIPEGPLPEDDLPPEASGRFEPQVLELEDVENGCSSELRSFRAIPKRWSNHLKRRPCLEGFRSQLSRWCQGYQPLIVEVCCRENSCIGSVCEKMHIPHIGISEEIDIKNPNTALFLRQLLDHKGDIMFWIASPCTAGCRLRHIRLHYPKHFSAWQRNFRTHRGIWRSLNAIFDGRQERRRCYLFQEWPISCDLWLDSYYRKIQRRLGLQYDSEVCRCCLDGFKKVWKVRCNSEKGSELLQLPLSQCQCSERREISLTESGYYTWPVAKHFVEAMFKLSQLE